MLDSSTIDHASAFSPMHNHQTQERVLGFNVSFSVVVQSSNTINERC